MAIVRVTIDKQPLSKTLRLQDVPVCGELIELADGTRIIVSEIERNSHGVIDAEVRAKPAR